MTSARIELDLRKISLSPPRGSATNETFSLRWIYRSSSPRHRSKSTESRRFARRGPVSRANRCLLDADPAIGLHAVPSKGCPFDAATSRPTLRTRGGTRNPRGSGSTPRSPTRTFLAVWRVWVRLPGLSGLSRSLSVLWLSLGRGTNGDDEETTDRDPERSLTSTGNESNERKIIYFF